MLEAIVRYSVRRRVIVLVASALLTVVGVWLAPKLPIDAMPDVTNVQVTVLTPSPGLSPLEVEQYLTFPIEMSLNGLPGLEQIRSVSRTGISAITVVFHDNVNVWFARQLVAERLRQAEADIPEGYGKPELGPVATGLGDIYEFVLHSDRHTPMELRTTLQWDIIPKLRQVPGVIEVNALGGEAKQFQVSVDPRKLAARGLTLARVAEALRRNNQSVGGGYIEKNGESIVIRGDALVRNLADLRKIVVTADADGTPVLLEHLSKVDIGAALPFGAALQLGRGPVVIGTVMMLIGSNSRQVVKQVKDKVDEVQKTLPAGMHITSFYDRSEFIGRVLATVGTNLAEGALLVFGVLLLALGSLTGAALAALIIPLAMLLAVMGMQALGVVGNVMSLGAIDFGLLVDGAIVMLEATIAHVALTRPSRQEIPEAVAHATSQVARPVAFAVAIIFLVYLPLMSLQGVEGKMFRPMAITVALALAAALLFTLTTFPAALACVMRPAKNGAHGEGSVLRYFGSAYLRGLHWTSTHGRLTVAATTVAVVVSLFMATQLGADFVPRIFEGEMVIDVRRLPSIALGEAKRLDEKLAKVVGSMPEVRGVVVRTGRAEVATDPVGPDASEVVIKLKERSKWPGSHDPDDLAERMKRRVEAEVPATFVAMSQPIENRVSDLLAGAKADVVVRIFGDDLATLKRVGDEVAAVMRDVPGTGDLRVQRILGLPLLEVKVDRVRLARYGIPADEVLKSVASARVGQEVGKVFEGRRRFDVVLKLPAAAVSEEGLSGTLVGSEAGNLVPIGQVAEVRRTEGPAVISRQALQRRILVEANVRGRDLVSYVHEAQERIQRKVRLPSGYSIEWGGQFENFTRAAGRLSLVVPMALAIIFVMLFLMFGDAGCATAVFASVPFGLIGGVLGLWLRGMPFSIPAGVGFIALCGVAVLNGVVMTSYLLRRLANATFEEAMRQSAGAVLRPVLTTAAVAALGFLPMAISNAPGSEVQRPLATVVIGGVISSTLLTLLVLPVLLRRVLRSHRPQA